MYKIITHTIKEEHFNHPLTAKSAMAGRNQQQQPVNPFTTDSAIKYRDSVKTAITNWITVLRSLVVATDKDEISTLIPEAQKAGEMFTSTVFGTYMLPVLFETVNKPFQTYNQSLIDSILAIKNKSNVTDAKYKVQQDAMEVSKVISRINRFWTEKALSDLFVPIADEFDNQVEMREAKKFDEDLLSMDMVNQLALSGKRDGQQPLVDVLSKGMILLFTSRFR